MSRPARTLRSTKPSTSVKYWLLMDLIRLTFSATTACTTLLTLRVMVMDTVNPAASESELRAAAVVVRNARAANQAA